MERGSGAFIEGADGGRISPSTAQKRIKRFCRVAAERGLRLPDITIENMRHSFATSYLHAGGNIEDLSRILGHSDINTTYRRWRSGRPSTISPSACRRSCASSRHPLTDGGKAPFPCGFIR